ncbi:MAG: sodium-dependent transporter [candidate division Zixibacteria bacterium]|nr:sodium-dependent transporter [candidate division Zixibacteria bacterium]
MIEARGQWSGRLGFVLAASGSAIGLGNLWKFPYITWQNGGGAFVLVYLLSILLIGLPIMMAEIMIGRRTGKSTIPALQEMGGKGWGLVGVMGVLAGFVILGYYSVIAGWAISSFWECLNWSISGYRAPDSGAFGAFVSNGPLQLALSGAFSLATIGVVWLGVSKGIERVTKILMPMLFVIMLYFLVTVLTMDGASRALSFMFTPNFADLPPLGILEAVGHSFFTLSLGMGLMITYGSYLKKDMSVTKVSGLVVGLDTLVALVATMIMFTIIFSFPGVEEQVGKSTVGMLFITLPNLFYTGMPGGAILGPLFFVLVGFAALTSTISLLEVMVAYFIDGRGMKRSSATMLSGAGTYVSTVFCALSLGAVGWMSSFELFPGKQGVLNTLDHLASNWMLPLGGLFITIFVGWKLDKRLSLEELKLTDDGGQPSIYFKLWRIVIRYVAPAAIIAVIIAVITGKDFS